MAIVVTAVYALDSATGCMWWRFKASAGSLEAHFRAYDTRDGSVLWDFDAVQAFHTTNGLRAHGGSLKETGPAIVSRTVYVNAGYTNAMTPYGITNNYVA